MHEGETPDCRTWRLRVGFPEEATLNLAPEGWGEAGHQPWLSPKAQAPLPRCRVVPGKGVSSPLSAKLRGNNHLGSEETYGKTS